MARHVLIAVLAVAGSAIGFGKTTGTGNKGADLFFVVAHLHTTVIDDDRAF